MKREIYDADHESFRDSVRSFLDRDVKPSWDKYIEAKQFPREMWLAFGRQGLLGLELPEQYGGSAAGDFRYNAVLCEELGKVSMSLGSCTASTPTSSRRRADQRGAARALAAELRVRRDPHGHRHDRAVRWL